MKRISIDLSEPLESVLTKALTLRIQGVDGEIDDSVVKAATRRLYDAANGRNVDTPLGRIPIAPAVAPWLKSAPLAVRTRHELVALAGLSSNSNGSVRASEVAGP